MSACICHHDRNNNLERHLALRPPPPRKPPRQTPSQARLNTFALGPRSPADLPAWKNDRSSLKIKIRNEADLFVADMDVVDNVAGRCRISPAFLLLILLLLCCNCYVHRHCFYCLLLLVLTVFSIVLQYSLIIWFNYCCYYCYRCCHVFLPLPSLLTLLWSLLGIFLLL